MKKWLKRIALAIALLIAIPAVILTIGVLWPEPVARPVVTTGPVVIRNVTVVDVERGALIPSQSVVIERGRILSVGAEGTVAIPQDARAIDGRGRYLMPALWDMHTHVYAVSPLLDLPLYIAYGVTNVRDLQGCPKPNDPFIACAEEKRLWGREGEAGLRVAPRVISTTSFMANGPTILNRIKGAHLVRAGLTPAEALKTATVNPAEYFGLRAEYGTVARGRKADLILLGANPLADIRNAQRIEAVVFNGNVYDADAIAALRAHVARQARSWTVACKLVWPFLKNPVSY